MWKKYPGKTESPGDGLDLAYCFNFIYFVYLLQFHASGSTVIAESGRVLRLLQKLAADTGIAVPWLTEHIVRKCAHFIEYTGLGMLLRQSDACVRRNRTVSEKMRIEDLVDRGDGTGRMCALTPDGHIWLEIHRIAIFAVPFLDETIQLFTEGRSGQISDVWLDMAGALTGTVLYLAARRIYLRIKKE